jgi:hypothetical protein
VSPGRSDRRFGCFGRGYVRENDHYQALQRPGFFKALDGHIHALLPAVGPDLESVERHTAFLPEHFLEGAGQFVAQARRPV